MKKGILYAICFVVGIFSSCKSQNVSGLDISEFVKQLETEINDKAFYRAFFSDTVQITNLN